MKKDAPGHATAVAAGAVSLDHSIAHALQVSNLSRVVDVRDAYTAMFSSCIHAYNHPGPTSRPAVGYTCACILEIRVQSCFNHQVRGRVTRRFEPACSVVRILRHVAVGHTLMGSCKYLHAAGGSHRSKHTHQAETHWLFASPFHMSGSNSEHACAHTEPRQGAMFA
jgi:hypothetical protein